MQCGSCVESCSRGLSVVVSWCSVLKQVRVGNATTTCKGIVLEGNACSCAGSIARSCSLKVGPMDSAPWNNRRNKGVQRVCSEPDELTEGTAPPWANRGRKKEPATTTWTKLE
eukprot:3083939-Amphidinium_carterae.1